MLIRRRAFLTSIAAAACTPMAAVQPGLVLGQSETSTIKPRATIEVSRDRGQVTSSVISTLSLSPAADKLAGAGDDHVIRIWRTDSQELLLSLRGHIDWVRCLSFTPDGKRLISAGDDRQIRVWEMPSGRELNKPPAHQQPIYCAAHNKDGSLLATAGFDQPVTLYDDQGTLAARLTSSSRDMRTLSFSPNGEKLAAAGRDGRVYVWKLAGRELVLQPRIHRRPVRALTFSPDGKLIASAGDDRFIRLSDTATGEEVMSLDSRPGKIMALYFVAPRLLASGGSDNVIRLWDLDSKRDIRQLVAHRGSVTSLVYDPQTATLMSGSYDTTVRFWDLGPRGPGNTADSGTTTTR